MSKVLIVDDEEEAVEVLSDFLSDLGYSTKTALDGEAAIEMLKNTAYDIVILDLRMPKIDGEGVMKVLQEENQKAKIIVMTGYSDNGITRERMEKYNITAYLEKPLDLVTLEKTIKKVQQTA